MIVPNEIHPRRPDLDGDTPMLRLVALLERVASKDQLFSLQALVDDTGLPKPTLHRMLQQLEGAGLLRREGDGRHYGTGVRLRRLAENLLLNDTLHGARHAVLRHLVDEVGESCNITALSGSEVIYLDRVETPAPLRFYLHPGSRVPVHCSASGKVFLAQMSAGAAPAPAGRMRRCRSTRRPPLPTWPRSRGSCSRCGATATRWTARSSCPAWCAWPCACHRPRAQGAVQPVRGLAGAGDAPGHRQGAAVPARVAARCRGAGPHRRAARAGKPTKAIR